MSTVKQPSARPTNKLTAAMLGTLLVSMSTVFVRNMWPDWDEPDVWLALYPVSVWAFGYFIKDEKNT